VKIVPYLFIISFLFCGCLSPLRKNEKAAEKVEKTRDAIQSNQQKKNDAARDYVFGANYVLLLDPNPSKYSVVAGDFTSRSLAVTGSPDLENSLAVKKIVSGLVSTNTAEVKSAESALKQKDAAVIALENKADLLQSRLDKAEAKAKEVAAENAGYANTWIKIKHIFYWVIGIIIFALILQLISSLVPPPYSFALSAVSMFFGGIGLLVKKIVPSSLHFMGAVGKDAYDQSENALKKLVSSIQEIKKNKPEIFEDHLKEVLKDKTNEETRAKIFDVKKDLGHI
jgi:hypothetical protein